MTASRFLLATPSPTTSPTLGTPTAAVALAAPAPAPPRTVTCSTTTGSPSRPAPPSTASRSGWTPGPTRPTRAPPSCAWSYPGTAARPGPPFLRPPPLWEPARPPSSWAPPATPGAAAGAIQTSPTLISASASPTSPATSSVTSGWTGRRCRSPTPRPRLSPPAATAGHPGCSASPPGSPPGPCATWARGDSGPEGSAVVAAIE